MSALRINGTPTIDDEIEGEIVPTDYYHVSAENPATLSFFANIKALTAHSIDSYFSPEDLFEQFLGVPTVTTDKGAAQIFIRGRCEGNRSKANTSGMALICLDLDSTPLTLTKVSGLLWCLEVDHVGYTTWSHGLKPNNCFRIVSDILVPTSHLECATRELVAAMGLTIKDKDHPDGDVDPASWDTLVFFMPSVHPDREDMHLSARSDIGGSTWLPVSEPESIAPTSTREGDGDEAAVRGDFRPEDVEALLSFCADNDLMVLEADWKRVAMAMAHWNHEDAWTLLDAASGAAGGNYDAALNEAHFLRFRKNAATRTGDTVTLGSVMKLAREAGYTGHFRGPTAQEDFAEILAEAAASRDATERWVIEAGVSTYSDLWRAQRVGVKFGHKIIWIEVLNLWGVFDGVRWNMSLSKEVSRLVQADAKDLQKEALDVPREVEVDSKGEPKMKDGKAVYKPNPLLSIAKEAQANHKIRATVDLLKSQFNIARGEMELDADTHLLNVENGTLDLRTHELRPHDAADLITKLAPVAYNPEARCPLWDSFITRALPDPEIRDFFQRLMGYALQGGQAEKCFGIVTGPADGGKSTALLACAAALGASTDRPKKNTGSSGAVSQAYATSTPISTFSSKRLIGGNDSALVRLMGTRLITISEVMEGDALRSELLKGWTGGDAMSAAPKYGHQLEFKPNGTIVMVGNELPAITFADDAMWGRVMIVEFLNSIPKDEQIKDLVTRFDLSAVLAWMVEGHRAYQERGGLEPPKNCTLRKEKHRADMDPLAEFWEDRIVLDQGAELRAADLYYAYREGCEAEGLRGSDILGKKAVTTYFNRLADQPGSKFRRKGKEVTQGRLRGWIGVRLRASEDDPR